MKRILITFTIIVFIFLLANCVWFAFNANDKISDASCSILFISKNGQITVDRVVYDPLKRTGQITGFLSDIGKLDEYSGEILIEFAKEKIGDAPVSATVDKNNSLSILYYNEEDNKTKIHSLNNDLKKRIELEKTKKK
jgi:hypothetical protein